MRSKTWSVLTILVIAILVISPSVFSNPVQVRVDRWLELRQQTGSVTFQPADGSSRSAAIGDRLQAVGDTFTTVGQSTATLEVDTGIGVLNVSENTIVRVQRLDIASDNGRITHLDVPQGQVRLQVRPFTHRGSELEIHTPAGVSGVRGTQFGMTVQPDGKTGVATLEGRVDTLAQGQTVSVPAGFQNLTIPGEPPSPAVPLRDDPSLEYRVVRVIENGIRRVQIIGKVDPVNTVLLDDTLQEIDRDGEFNFLLPARSTVRFPTITVITPLGTRQVHELAIEL